MNPIFSIIASAHRTKDWLDFYKSIKTNLEFEIIFVGEKAPDFKLPNNFHYIYSPVKPTQCAEIAIRNSKGELVHWTADDAEYSPQALDKVYDLYKKENNYKCMIGFHLFEQALNGKLYEKADVHRCAGLLAIPFGVISRKFIDEIGIYDINFIAGQCENDMVLRGYEAGGYVKICYGAELYNMETKHGLIEYNFQPSRPYEQKLLLDLWTDDKVHFRGHRKRPLEPFKEDNILIVNQGPSGKWGN